MIKFEKQELEIMKKCGQVIGHVGDNYISEIYQLDRTRTAEEFEKQIKNISLRAMGIGKKEENFLYTEPLANLMNIINKYKSSYDEIKDIVLVYATYYLGAIKYSKSQSKGGK